VKTVATVAALREALASARREGKRIGFVPTMGALHQGHLSLLAIARENCDLVVASVFVNPRQFDRAEDLERYPRDLEGDSARLAGAGCDVLFAPIPDEIYPEGFSTSVHVAGVSEGMEGARRPGHFDGVATVVTRLFCLVLPDVTVFGAKDGQQVAVLSRLTADLGLPIRFLVGPTVREADGLALSSRNLLLTPEERTKAPALFRSLLAAQLAYELGERDAEKLMKLVRMALATEPTLKLDALDLVDAATMQPVRKIDRPVMLAIAAFLGRVRPSTTSALGAKTPPWPLHPLSTPPSSTPRSPSPGAPFAPASSSGRASMRATR
jgi:pantoate--beta-alanine ligase